MSCIYGSDGVIYCVRVCVCRSNDVISRSSSKALPASWTYVLHNLITRKFLSSISDRYTVYIVQSTVYSVQCTVYSVQYTKFNVQCRLYNVQCSVYNLQLTMNIVQLLTIYSVQCTMYIVHSI